MKTVLIADDEYVFAEALGAQLRDAGFQTEAVWNGAAMLERVARGGVDLLILDLMMPGMDGTLALTHLRRTHSPAQLPVIVISGLPTAIAQAQLGQAVEGLLDKTFIADELIVMVNRLLAS
jgi:two-component system response regulator RegX3